MATGCRLNEFRGRLDADWMSVDGDRMRLEELIQSPSSRTSVPLETKACSISHQHYLHRSVVLKSLDNSIVLKLGRQKLIVWS